MQHQSLLDHCNSRLKTPDRVISTQRDLTFIETFVDAIKMFAENMVVKISNVQCDSIKKVAGVTVISSFVRVVKSTTSVRHVAEIKIHG